MHDCYALNDIYTCTCLHSVCYREGYDRSAVTPMLVTNIGMGLFREFMHNPLFLCQEDMRVDAMAKPIRLSVLGMLLIATGWAEQQQIHAFCDF